MNKFLRWEISRKRAWMLLTVIVVTGLAVSSITAETADTLAVDQSGVTNETRAIAVDREGKVYVTGESTGVNTEFDYATARYNQQDVGSAACVPHSWNIRDHEITTNNFGFGSSDFEWAYYNANKTFEGTARASAADLGPLGCFLDPDCNLLGKLLSLVSWGSGVGEKWWQFYLRLEGEPGTQRDVLVESTLEGLLITAAVGIAGGGAKVDAELSAQPSGGLKEQMLDVEEEMESALADVKVQPVGKAGTALTTLTVGDELHIVGKLRAEAWQLSSPFPLPFGGAAAGLSLFTDDPPIGISQPGLRFKVSIVNAAPIVTADQATVIVDEGQVASNSGTLCDPDGDPVTLTASVGTITNNNDGTWSWSFTTSDGPDESQTVTITANDGKGGTSQITFDLTVKNVAPDVDAGPDQTVFRNDAVALSGTWIDPAGSLDNPYAWTWDLTGDGSVDSSGTAAYGDTVAASTSFALEGLYTLTFQVADKDGGLGGGSLVVEVLNQPPDCSSAEASVQTIWPPNHKFVSIDVLGVTDPEGDPISISIDSIFQDEPVDTEGDGSFTPDGQGVGAATAEVRAERAGSQKVPGNGRVYHIGFTADDGHGGSCLGVVLVGVPHDQKDDPVDDGALYDSTMVP